MPEKREQSVNSDSAEQGGQYLEQMILCACVLGCFSRVQLLCVLPWTVVSQASLSMGFTGVGLLCPSFPGNLPNLGSNPRSPASPELAGFFYHQCPLGKTDVFSGPQLKP